MRNNYDILKEYAIMGTLVTLVVFGIILMTISVGRALDIEYNAKCQQAKDGQSCLNYGK